MAGAELRSAKHFINIIIEHQKKCVVKTCESSEHAEEMCFSKIELEENHKNLIN